MFRVLIRDAIDGDVLNVMTTGLTAEEFFDWRRLYCPLTTLPHHDVMETIDAIPSHKRV
jgi:hypothetical protein